MRRYAFLLFAIVPAALAAPEPTALDALKPVRGR